MPAYSRRDIVDEDRVGVTTASLDVFEERSCAVPTRTQLDYSHRKAWVRDRLRQFAGLFGVEVCDMP
jgi:hypothetical protein